MTWLAFLAKRHLWSIVRVTVVGLCAVFIGKASAHFVEEEFLVTDEVVQHRPSAPLLATRQKSASTILERDIFCSGCPAMLARSAEQKRAAETAATGPERSTLPLSLGAVVLTEDGASSIAVLRDMTKPKPSAQWFHSGDTLFATNAILERIGERRVYLQDGDKAEFLDLTDPVKPATLPAKPAAGAPIQDALGSQIDHGVRCNGGSCEVARSLVDQLLANTSYLASTARFVPAIQNGTPSGFRVYAIRSGSLFDKLGVQNGDRIVSINGMSLATPDQALQLYTKLRSASHLSMQLDRRGAVTTLDYTIR